MHLIRNHIRLVLVLSLLFTSVIGSAQVPYKATLASTTQPVIIPPGIEGNDCPDFIPLPDGSTMAVPEGLGVFKFVLNAVGHSTLMGLTVDVQTHCVAMPLDPNIVPKIGDSVPFFNGFATLTGANGDKIFCTYFGLMTVTERGMVIDGTLITIGGTGRFVGATGIGKAFGVQTFTGESALTLTGTMSSPGSRKK